MDFSYSPGHSPELLQLSPTRMHDVNPLLELRNLRRSMSRSPSRMTRSSPRSQFHSPSNPPHSPLRHHMSQPLSTYQQASQNPQDENGPPSVRRPRAQRPALTRATPIRGLFKTAQAHAQTSPVNSRALTECSDAGNASRESLVNQESTTPQGSPVEAHENAPFQKHVSIPISTPNTRSRSAVAIDKDNTSLRDWMPAKSSPLKRSDGSLLTRESRSDSPSVKRRSLNDGSSGEVRQDSSPVQDDISPEEAAFRASLPPSAFAGHRKSLLQTKSTQKPGPNRNRRSLESGVGPSTPKRTSGRPRPRKSFDSALSAADVNDDRPIFDSPTPSPDFLRVAHNTRSTRQAAQPHPLSQTVTTNSPQPSFARGPEAGSASSFAQRMESSERPSIFSKSLPAGALRPQEPKFVQGAEEGAFATPQSFQFARPDPAAFRSTGLISKKHRNPEDLPPPPNGRAGMPDTPCKKSSGITIGSSPGVAQSISKPRFGQSVYGNSSRPFAGGRPIPAAFAKPEFNRRESFNSIDGEESAQSPSRGRESQHDSQSSADDMPPTPTKPSSFVASGRASSLRSSLFGRVRPALDSETFVTPPVPAGTPFSHKSSSPQDKLPQTPAAHDGVPDPSFLSISPSNKTPLSPVLRNSFGSSGIGPPVTPSHRISGGPDSMTGIIATPGHSTLLSQDIDPVIRSRFKAVEWYGRGEFSEVYKVYQATDRSSFPFYSPMTASKNITTPLPDKVYIVKKSKTPYPSNKMRQKKLQEPHIMRALGRSDHTVFLVDFWEAKRHLYMQMEFCEEGNLTDFLTRQGREGRLDDFRIWKILLEMCLGVQHIHDSGYMHLDLKPDNVFIDFEGTLKIGDFGLASQWPAPQGCEGEGDRRYMGMDLLRGKIDKPADIFALGMIIYEIAANFVPPDNGGWWQKLRSGDFSGLPSLTSGSSNSLGDAQVMLNTSSNYGTDLPGSDDSFFEAYGHHASIDTRMVSWNLTAEDSYDIPDAELATPPAFMMDADDAESLDNIVHRMMQPEPETRPTVAEVLGVAGCEWVGSRRRAGAIIYEGRWGPADHMIVPKSLDQEDSIMTDV